MLRRQRSGSSLQSRIGVAALLLPALLLCGCVSLMLERGFPRTSGLVSGLPLSAPVTVRRDSYGIPHIFAQNEEDLFFAQGYVHAQDRLFQMEMIRRLVTGSLAEVLGRSALDTDHFARLAGFPDLRRRAAAGLGERERRLLAAYTAGINSYLKQCGGDLPVECRILGFRPRPWSPEDALSNIVIFSWGLAVNYPQELLSLQAGQPLSRWNELFPAGPGGELPPDRYFESLDLRQAVAGLLPAAYAMVVPNQLTPGNGRAGSNAWAVAAGADGLPLLANDPHLSVAVPQFWYFCHLHAPGLDAAGASVAGTPGVLIGRNRTLAWGLTNMMADYVDLFIVRLDPHDPRRYFVDGQAFTMSERKLSIPLRNGRAARTVYTTRFGPVISEIEEGAESAVVLKWYGTLPAGQLQDHTLSAVLTINRAASVEEAMSAAAGVSVLGLNLVMADSLGHIGWRAVGAIPIRRGYSGRLPADGSSGEMDWEGFLPPDALPRSVDPPRGRLANANQSLPAPAGSAAIGHSWCHPYRYQRIETMLASLEAPKEEDFRTLQLDVLSLQAEKLLPRILDRDYSDPRAREAAGLLAGWDRRVEAGSPAAALWELFVGAWLRLLVEDDLGKHSDAYLNLVAFFYSLPDEILDRPDSPLWDRQDTPEHENSHDILEQALIRALADLKQRLGPDRSAWRWGGLHKHSYEHPGAVLGLLSRHLNRGEYPASGDAVTVQATGFLPGQNDYKVVWHPSMRMIAALGSDSLLLMGPMGQSGQPGHPHYDDMIAPWQEGELLRLGLAENAPGGDTACELALVP
jgi:penicillin amidase